MKLVSSLSLVGSFLVAASLALVGCGSETEPGAAAAPGLTPAALAGQWVSPACEAYPDGQGGTTYLTRDFTLSETRWSLSLGVFGDAACSYPLFSAEIEGPYALGAPSADVPGATEGQFGFATNTWTARDPALADLFTQSGCGSAPWVVGEPQEVSGTGCIGVAHPVAECPEEHDVVALTDGALHFGERVTDLCAAEGRPKALGAYGLVHP